MAGSARRTFARRHPRLADRRSASLLSAIRRARNDGRWQWEFRRLSDKAGARLRSHAARRIHSLSGAAAVGSAARPFGTSAASSHRLFGTKVGEYFYWSMLFTSIWFSLIFFKFLFSVIADRLVSRFKPTAAAWSRMSSATGRRTGTELTARSAGFAVKTSRYPAAPISSKTWPSCRPLRDLRRRSISSRVRWALQRRSRESSPR